MVVHATPPPVDVSPDGRRVLVAPVTGPIGERIQRWRALHDPSQARRIPPHATLCYWVPTGDVEALDRQVRHAFDRPVTAHLAGVREFGNADRTVYVEVGDAEELDRAKERLYDGLHVSLDGRRPWTWHITCIRYGHIADPTVVDAARRDLEISSAWRLESVALLELRQGVYEPVATWTVPTVAGAPATA
ncbi:MAG: 2'-5' RNA ligase family protein [Chloroflexota bacterium]